MQLNRKVIQYAAIAIACVLIIFLILENTGIVTREAVYRDQLQPSPPVVDSKNTSEHLQDNVRLRCKGGWIRILACGALSMGSTTQTDYNERLFPSNHSPKTDYGERFYPIDRIPKPTERNSSVENPTITPMNRRGKNVELWWLSTKEKIDRLCKSNTFKNSRGILCMKDKATPTP
jgi:hypothetical protein